MHLDQTYLAEPLPPWYLIAMGEVGTSEIVGPVDNPRIQEYLAATSMGPHMHDEVPWCAAFVGWCLKAASLHPSGSAAARSYLDWGTPLMRPRTGCIALFQRPPSRESGHVAFYSQVNHTDPSMVDCLGGNQGNRVCVAAERMDRLLGYRWPSGYAIPSR